MTVHSVGGIFPMKVGGPGLDWEGPRSGERPSGWEVVGHCEGTVDMGVLEKPESTRHSC